MSDPLIITVGKDQVGNKITYMKSGDRDWVSLYMQCPIPDEIARKYLLDDLAEQCACVLPEHSCPYCREISRLQRTEEMPY